MRVVIVVPTIRESSIASFFEAWKGQFAEHPVIVIEDNPERTFDISGSNIQHFCWENIDQDLGSDSWIIPRRTDCVRSYGYYKAFLMNPDMIVTLDDDCYPGDSDFLAQHYEKLSRPAKMDAWVPTGRGPLTRGVPYHNLSRSADCVVNHGLWDKVPDFDAVMQLANGRFNQPFEPLDQVIPKGSFFAMCGMNLAFKPSVVPALYFLLMGKSWPVDRFGDIWCGLFLKKICDHLGLAVCSGSPRIEHQRASNVWVNLHKEVTAYETNENLWQAIDSIVLTKTSFQGCYKEIAEKLPLTGEYWDRLRTAMHVWAELFPASEQGELDISLPNEQASDVRQTKTAGKGTNGKSIF